MASATMLAAARSFTDPPGLTHSALASISTPSEFRVMRWKRNSGVLPILWSRLCPKARGTDMSFRAASFIVLFDETKRRADDQFAVKLRTVSYGARCGAGCLPSAPRSSASASGSAAYGAAECHYIGALYDERQASSRPKPIPRRLRLRLRHNPQIGPGRFPAVGIDLLSLFIGDGTRYDDVVTLLPIHRGGYLMLGGQL